MDIKTLLGQLNNHASLALQEKWDNSGIQLLTDNSDIEKIVLTLDIDEQVIDFAVKNNANLVISHHPLIFSGIKSIDYRNYQHRIIISSIINGINIISLHTNIDKSLNGLADYFAGKINLENIQPLSSISKQINYKVVTFLPQKYLEDFLNFFKEHNISIIGTYKACSFFTSGFGTFYPEEGSLPFSGEINRLNVEDESRLEFMVSDNFQDIIKTLKKIHPYEEPVFDIYKLYNSTYKGALGRIGNLPKPMRLTSLIENIKKIFNVPVVRFIGDNEDILIKKVAICPGSGMSLLKDVVKHHVDIFITGDVKYHDALNAQQLNLNIIDMGHFHSEFIFTELLKDILSQFYNGEILIFNQEDIFKYK